MADDITVIERPGQFALCISETVPTMKLGKVMGPAYMEIMEHLKSQGIECSDQDIPFARYRNLDWDTLNKKGPLAFIKMMLVHKWEIDIGIPCPESTSGAGRIQAMTLESGKFVRTIHRGPYMKVGDTYKRIRAFATERNLVFKNYSMEFYLNDPCVVSADQLETEVLVPLL
ncbi:GyrI-like domain-containing protein [Planctomycetota bacterium]